MPRKIRQLVRDLKRAGFIELKGRGKGDHRMFRHPAQGLRVILDGQDGDDAKPYQERDVRRALKGGA